MPLYLCNVEVNSVIRQYVEKKITKSTLSRSNKPSLGLWGMISMMLNRRWMFKSSKYKNPGKISITRKSWPFNRWISVCFSLYMCKRTSVVYIKCDYDYSQSKVNKRGHIGWCNGYQARLANLVREMDFEYRDERQSCNQDLYLESQKNWGLQSTEYSNE